MSNRRPPVEQLTTHEKGIEILMSLLLIEFIAMFGLLLLAVIRSMF